MSFLNKVVIVTGAGSGIGKATAVHFAKLSASLSLIDNNGQNLEECYESCLKLSGVKVLKHVIDLRNDEAVKSVVDETEQVFGNIDVVVNGAGIIYMTDSKILSANAMDIYDNIMAVNLRAVVRMTTCAAPMLIKSKGCIVNISSVVALMPTEDCFAYSVSKAAVSHFTKCAALELSPHGVRVNAVLPGGTKTGILKNAGLSEEQSDTVWNTVKEQSPLKRLVAAEEVAELVVFLASDAAKSITGSNYTIDAGLLLKLKVPEVKADK